MQRLYRCILVRVVSLPLAHLAHKGAGGETFASAGHIPRFPFLWDGCGVRRLWFPVGLLLFNTIPYQSFLKLDVGSVVLTHTLTMDNSQQRISWLSQR